MKNHVLRPLWLALAAIALLLVARYIMVPGDFGVHGRNFTYGFHRLGNIGDWQNFPAKYKNREYCNECHEDKVAENSASKHREIQCENCHGPAYGHPDDPEKLIVDRSREQCLRCHELLPYPGSLRGKLKGIDPEKHNPDQACADCHNPHHPDQEVGS
jgi:hypothetical protein